MLAEFLVNSQLFIFSGFIAIPVISVFLPLTFSPFLWGFREYQQGLTTQFAAVLITFFL